MKTPVGVPHAALRGHAAGARFREGVRDKGQARGSVGNVVEEKVAEARLKVYPCLCR